MNHGSTAGFNVPCRMGHLVATGAESGLAKSVLTQIRRHLTGEIVEISLATHGWTLARRASICSSHSTNVLLDHPQMDPQSLQIDFEWACNLERPHRRVNFGDSRLIRDQSGSVRALNKLAFEISLEPGATGRYDERTAICKSEARSQ